MLKETYFVLSCVAAELGTKVLVTKPVAADGVMHRYKHKECAHFYYVQIQVVPRFILRPVFLHGIFYFCIKNQNKYMEAIHEKRNCKNL